MLLFNRWSIAATFLSVATCDVSFFLAVKGQL